MKYAKLIAAVTERPISTPSTPSRSRGRSRCHIWYWFSLILGAIWIVPAIAVLCLSFSNHIVGISIGCPSCRIDLHATTQIQQTQQLAKWDQNALASLQLAAKALEAWFCFAAASLVWSLLRKFAGQDSARPLPVGYLHLHTEVVSLDLLRKLAWGRRQDARLERKRAKAQGWWNKSRLYIFIILVAFICLLCNLMGPATAILVIPNLEWIPINQAQNVWFRDVMCNQRPLDNTSFPGCSKTQLEAADYSCTVDLYGASTDMIAAAAVATDDQIYNWNKNETIFQALLLPPILQQGNISFTVNISGSTVWVPVRQVLRDLSRDLMDYDTATRTGRIEQDYPNSNLFNRSLQTRLQQRGPVFGQSSSCYKSNKTVDYSIDSQSDRHVRCYTESPQTRTTCIPVGKAWENVTQAFSEFIIPDIYRSGNASGSLTVSIYATSTSIEMDSLDFECLMGKNCPIQWNWITAFGNDSSMSRRRDLAGPQQIFQYKRVTPLPGNSFIWCSMKTSFSLSDYVLNPSQLSNMIRLVELNVLDEKTAKIPPPQQAFIHPDWTLAAYSINKSNGLGNGQRGVSRRLIMAFEGFIENGSFNQSALDFRNTHKFMVAQTLSMIPYSTVSTKPHNTFLQPELPRKAMVQVWKYDRSSISSVFGIVIVLLGCIVVVARTAVYKEDMKDATEILVSAMKKNASTPLLTPSQWLEEGEKEDDEDDFPVFKVDESPKRIPYNRRISFHG